MLGGREKGLVGPIGAGVSGEVGNARRGLLGEVGDVGPGPVALGPVVPDRAGPDQVLGRFGTFPE